MFSRVALAQLAPKDVTSALIRPITSTAVNRQASSTSNRPVRPEHSPKVRLGFLPESWFTAFYPKTGVTGPYVLAATVGTYLLSKEIYILEHEYYSGLSILIMLAFATKKFGSSVAKALDKEVDSIANEFDAGRQDQLKALEDSIKAEEKALWQAEGQRLLIAAKKENIALQQEAIYRERLMAIYNAVKQRLDYQVSKQEIERRASQKNLVDWVVRNVLKNITPQQEKDTLAKCVADLNSLAARA